MSTEIETNSEDSPQLKKVDALLSAKEAVAKIPRDQLLEAREWTIEYLCGIMERITEEKTTGREIDGRA